jgi:hypothetical protein
MSGVNSSFLSWMDYSDHERRKMLDVIDLFAEQDTRDEMGIGTVRDAFADLFFPGTSTIQTRARYFLFIPWTYLKLERRGVSSRDLAAKARREEIALIDGLVASEDSDGTIGLRARASLKRLASNVYWQGLGAWGIRLFPGSQEQYHRMIDRYLGPSEVSRDDDGEPIDGTPRSNWHPGIPPASDGFPESVSFKLTRLEAEYLRERILTRVPATLLAFLVDRDRMWQLSDFPWEHPQFGEFPSRIKEQLLHARNFSEAIHGSVLVYNLMLAELVSDAELTTDYQARLRVWADTIETRRDAMSQWDQRRFWAIVLGVNPAIPLPTRMFVEAWLRLALSPEAVDIATSQPARRLLHERERALKRDQARLDNQRAREIWNGEAGTAQLTYRWPVAQAIVLDILTGLESLPPHA